MNNEIMITDKALEKLLIMWNDESQLKEIKTIYAKDLTDGEFKTFVQMGMAAGLNPFLREIWAIKYDKSAAAQIFIGRDGYRKVIGRNNNYDGHSVDAVYANDTYLFDVTKGEVTHTFNFKDRGRLIGAYCLVKMKNISRPFYVFVEVSEYNKGRSVWKDMPATMIKKVAECQAIRMADQTCAGTYDEAEMPNDKIVNTSDKSEKLNREYQLYEGESVNNDTGEITHAIEINQPVFSYDEIKVKMENAINSEILHEVASVISQMSITKEQHAELSKVYRDRLKEVKKLEDIQ